MPMMPMKRFVFLLATQWMLPCLASAAEPHVLFEDTFDEKLGDGWTWLRENTDFWRIKDGALEIRVEPGKANTVKNVLLRKAPDRSTTNFTVEVTITFTTDPTQQYEQGGITWYQQKKPVFKLVHEHIDGEDWIIPGRKSAPSKTVQLRLVIEGTQWMAQFRENPEGEFKTAASGKLPPPVDDQVSIQCYDGPAHAAHWIRFDDFRIVKLPD
jgi:regulation of enolase protein 1 (concanavalin A-like superfamily)